MEPLEEPILKKLSSVPCRFELHYTDRVPMPFGPGSCSMPGFECQFDGDESLIPEIEKQTECTPACPGYSPVKVYICPKHNEEYADYCSSCEVEVWENLTTKGGGSNGEV